MHYKIKVTFGEISLKFRQINWNVARNNINVVVDELPSQITIYTCLTIDIWTRRRQPTSMAALCALVPSAQIGGLPVNLVPKVFDFTMDTPSSPETALVRAMQCTQFVLKMREMTLSPRIS